MRMDLTRQLLLYIVSSFLVKGNLSFGKRPYRKGYPAVQFQDSLTNYTAIAGNSVVVLRCLFRNGRNLRKSWTNGSSLVFVNKEPFNADVPRVSLDRNTDEEYSLRLNGVTEYDEGEYSCSIYTEPDAKTRVVHLTVNVPARLTSNVSADEIIADEGDRIWLTCSATGKPLPVISWRHLIPTAAGVMGVGTHFPIIPVKRESSGWYECSADNKVGSPQTHRMKIFVRYAPEMDKNRIQKEAQISLEGKVVLKCIASGFPRPNFVWKHNGIEYRENPSVTNQRVMAVSANYGTYTIQSMLNFDSVNKEDFGDYECVAQNEKGNASMLLRLNEKRVQPMKKPPRGDFFDGLRNQGDKGSENSGASLHSLIRAVTVITPLLGVPFLISF